MNNEPSPIDLHIHSRYSDGFYPPADLVRMGTEAGLSAVSITDHDTIHGQEEALEAGRRFGIEVITGVEFSAVEMDRSIHILGYLFDAENAALRDNLEELSRAREERAREIVERLRSAGVSIDFEEVASLAGEGAIGRPHIAKILLDRGVVSYFQEAFSRYIGTGAPAYVRKRVLDAGRILGLISDAGGVAVWAHPGGDIEDGRLLDRLLGLGIIGVEVWHPNHERRMERRVQRIADSRGLVCTGGSDFHFEEAMIAPVGGKPVPRRSLDELKRLAGKA